MFSQFQGVSRQIDPADFPIFLSQFRGTALIRIHYCNGPTLGHPLPSTPGVVVQSGPLLPITSCLFRVLALSFTSCEYQKERLPVIKA